MRLVKRLSVCLALVATAVAPHVASADGGPSVMWGSYIDGTPFDSSKVDRFESAAGKRESIVHWAEPWEMNGNMMPFQTDQYEKVRQRGSIPMLSWGSWNLSAGIDDSNYSLARIYNGNYDAFLYQWARDAKAWGHPFFIRFDHEMNGWWYPWSEQRNGNQAGDYVRAWRHIVDIFRNVGATNATWVWCVNITDGRSTPLNVVYPGDNYVDWTSIDGYNKATGSSSWLWFDQIFGWNPWGKRNTYQDVLAVAPSKPIMIGEIATTNVGGDAGSWIRDFLQTQLPQHYQQVKAVVWFDWNAGDASLAYPIESTWAQQSAFQQSIGSGYYATNTFSSLPGGPIQPVGQPSSSGSQPSSSGQPSSGATTTVRILSDRDTSVTSANPNSNAQGSSDFLWTSTYTSDVMLLHFNLQSLAGKSIVYAQLNLITGFAASSVPHNVKLVTDNSWNESTSYNSMPRAAIGSWLGVITAPAPYTWYAAPLMLSGIQPRAGGEVSLSVYSDNPGWVTFASRENVTSQGNNSPQLLVVYK